MLLCFLNYYLQFKEINIYVNTLECLFMLYTGKCSIIQALKKHMHYTNCIYIDSVFSDKFLDDFDYVQVSKQHKQYITKSIQTMYYISNSTFKLMKPVKIYKVHHQEIVLLHHQEIVFPLGKCRMKNHRPASCWNWTQS